MRTTLRIDDDLLRDLKRAAAKQRTTLADLVNRLLRGGLGKKAGEKRQAPYQEHPVAMGTPRFNLDKALALAAALEDEETVSKIARRK